MLTFVAFIVVVVPVTVKSPETVTFVKAPAFEPPVTALAAVEST